MKKLLKIALIVLAVPLCAALALVIWLTVTEYRPAAVEPAALDAAAADRTLAADGTLSLLTFNVGYGGLGKSADFFMDGGEQVAPESRAQVEQNLAGIAAILAEQDADVTLLQETDADSARSFGIDERVALAPASRAFALNYSCAFVPYPLPPIGRVHSGLTTATGAEILSAERVALPCPFKWPVRTANLKRCLLAAVLPLAGTDRKLVVVNLHLEAYDDGSGKLAQTEALRAFLTAQYEAGNYVVAGGDFNQTFPGSLARYPIVEQDYWAPGTLDDSLLPAGWRFAYDLETPSCRLLNRPYDPNDPATQVYVIDGFILSPNIEQKAVRTVDAGFEYSDHNPVRLEITLK